MPDAQKGAGFDIVEAAVFHQKLDGSPSVGTRLNFIQKHQRIAGDHWLSGISGQTRNDSIGIQIPGEDLCRIGICDEIDLHKTGILFLAKLADNGRFAGLTCAHDTKSLFIRLPLPFQQSVICLSIQHLATP